MKTKTALFIAELLTDELKEETKNYKPYHSLWVEDLINTLKDYKDNVYYIADLEKLINDYYETKQWYEDKCQED